MRRTTLLELLLASVLAGCGSGGDTTDTTVAPVPPPSPPPTASADGVSLTLEPGWRAAGEDLTPNLLNPRTVLSVATFAMKPGGRCSHQPDRALNGIGPTDAMITIQERTGKSGSLAGYEPRPGHFDLDLHPGAFECAPDVPGQIIWFTDAGRKFYALVGIGPRGPQNEVSSVLDSFRAEP